MFRVIRKRKNIPEGLFLLCPGHGQIVYRKAIEENLNICPQCDYHFRLGARKRIECLVDSNSFEEFSRDLKSKDPLKFKFKGVRYRKRLKSEEKKSGNKEAMLVGRAFIKGRVVILAVMDPNFLMGTMGSVVGEKFCAAAEKAMEDSLPLLAVVCSGGARIHEGVISLMQMPKTLAVLTKFKEAKGFFISVLTDPTLGGVAASFAMLGDIIIAEPKALIGFAGPRTIEEIMKIKLPEGFQTAEFMMEHGFVDMIVHRKDLRSEISRIIDYCQKK